MALNTQPLARPEYLQGVTHENAGDNRTNGALHIFENGRLSTTPCRLCVEDNVDCIVASTISGRCMWCSYKSKRTRECLAEGVRTFSHHIPATAPQTASTVLQSIGAPTPASTLPVSTWASTVLLPTDVPTPASTLPATSAPPPGSNAVTLWPFAQVARQSVSPVEANSTADAAANPQSNTNRRAPTKQKQKQKRKRSLSDPLDAIELSAKRLCRDKRPTVTEHPYGPTAPGAKGQTSATTTRATSTEHSYVPIAPKATGHTSDPASEAITTQEITTFRYAPFGSIDYDLEIRTKDRVAWAQWANDLHKEIRSLRHVQDVGTYTTKVIAMMIEDGVWPMGNPIDLGED